MISNNKSKTGVSVICTCYNQIDYISDALDGFVSQQCTFPFEVIVHDDASSDGTADVVLRYATKYPNLIVPIIQSENQHSKGVSGIDIGISHARYSYIALCEGDDFWIDPFKLQKQFDFMESHEDYSLCLHNAVIENCNLAMSYLSESGVDREKTAEDIICEGGGEINPTASFFFRRRMLSRLCKGPVSDHFIMMELVSKGRVFWFADPMSVYRLNSKGSWSQTKSDPSIEAINNYYEKYQHGLEQFNMISNGRYVDAINELLDKLEISKLSQILRAEYLGNSISFRDLLLQSDDIFTSIRLVAEKKLPASCEVKIRRVIKRIQKRKLIIKNHCTPLHLDQNE